MAKFNVDGIQNVEVSKKLPPQMSPSEQLALMQRYTDTHRACADLSKEEREVRCLQVLYPALLRRMEPGDLFLGRLDFCPSASAASPPWAAWGTTACSAS